MEPFGLHRFVSFDVRDLTFFDRDRISAEDAVAEIYTLPDLPYDYDALEPHISAKVMQ
jgi:hypothetical protein